MRLCAHGAYVGRRGAAPSAPLLGRVTTQDSPVPRPSKPERFPDRVDLCFRLGVHQDFVRPWSRKTFGGPFARGVDTHLRSEVLHALRVIEGIDRAQRKLDVALRIERAERFPDDLAIV